MALLKTFVSFSSKDRDFVRALFARLAAQPITLWDYSSEGEEIPGGEQISSYLRARIHHCELFIPIVTQNSQNGDFTKIEVACALERKIRQAHLRIIPLVDSALLSFHKWNEPFEALKAFRFYEIDFKSKASLETAIQRICFDLQIDYNPLITEDPRLPFMDRFQSELDHEVPLHDERTNIIHRRLQQALTDFTGAFENGDYRFAEKAMDYFTSTCEYEFPQKSFYYPYIVKGVCLMARGEWIEAQEIFRSLLNHEKIDENVFGGLGYIKQQQGCYKEASCYYHEALRIDPHDAAAASGVLINNVLCGNFGAINNLLAILEEGEKLVPEDQIRSDKIKAYALASLGRSREAMAIWNRLIEKDYVKPEDIINLSKVLIDIGKVGESVQLLEHFTARFTDSFELLHNLASLYWITGAQDKAIERFEAIARENPDNRQYCFDVIFCLWKTDSAERARAFARQLLNSGLPETIEDFYRSGFANWVLGNDDRAKYDFERSGKPETEFYDHL